MNKEFEKPDQVLKQKCRPKQMESISLYPGIELTYLEFSTDTFPLSYEPLDHILQIHYCRLGRIGWKMENGTEVYLDPGNFSIHTMKACKNSTMIFPTGLYNGLLIRIDLNEAAKNPPDLLADGSIFQTLLREQFCKNDTFTSLAGNTETDAIFSCFYNQPEIVQHFYQKVKVLELLLYLSKTAASPDSYFTEYQSEQENLIREIHDYLLEHMEQRITIKDLSKKYHMNPTTLKTAFKSVYGISLASHIKEHRMTYAAKMLRTSDLSIAEIAKLVGYDSQSRFSDAFKAFFHVLPTEYRKQNRGHHAFSHDCIQ